MSVASQITRLTGLRDRLRTKLVSLGIVSGSAKLEDCTEAVEEITAKAGQTYTPGTQDQVISAGQYLTGAQTVKGDSNLIADNIADGVTVFGILGTHVGGIDTSDATLNSGGQMLAGVTAYADDVKYTGTIPTKGANDLTVSGATVTAPAGYYQSDVSKAVAAAVQATPSVSIGTDGLITATATQTAGYVSAGSKSGTLQLTARGSADMTASGATVTAPAGYYPEAASKAVASGTAGTPKATKGTVTNNSVTVTPSVTNTTGYITGGTKSGTAVTVAASELVSGTKAITASGTTDVTNYASASVAAGVAKTPATTVTANPSISVNSNTGQITATASATKSVTPTVTKGYVTAGTAGTVTVNGSNTSQLTVKGATVYTPTTTDQTIASGLFLTGVQTIKGDANLVPANILGGVSIFGVAGGIQVYDGTVVVSTL